MWVDEAAALMGMSWMDAMDAMVVVPFPIDYIIWRVGLVVYVSPTTKIIETFLHFNGTINGM